MSRVIFFATLLISAAVTMNAVWVYGTTDYVTITVTDKERIQDGEESKYLIFTENEVFENTDSLMKFKFNSSDVYGLLKVGETYSAEVFGWRVPFFSMYRNIVSIEKIN